jgi:hypothetical protein
VTFTVDPRLLAKYDVKQRGWTIPPGTYEVAIGTDAGTMKVNGGTRLSARKWRP